ncbi:homoserine kinase [Limnoraphis robusta]|uniref:homoserine kinase n=1 Tax=Limnoraphis robusta TaxID=1118279 RepID=UPI002B1F0068|nr:homoserine kinase [Limnoraphis robusta]MEA5495868.1 homoserine kinase [Limnoraphis robusta BA-68 BA1]
MSKSVTVTIPATTANLGPGFDCIGAALTLYNILKISEQDLSAEETSTQAMITVQGVDAERLSTDQDNLAYQAFIKLYQHLGQSPPPVKLEINLGFPLARGLGSSATAIVGGLVGANAFAGSPLSQTEVMNLAIAMEGHPDNVVPALLGNCQLSVAASQSHWEICEIPWHPSIIPIVAIPNFELSTTEARRVLPTEYSRTDAIFNTAHLGLLVRGLETGKENWLRVAMQDKIHQPYRQSLIIGYEAVRLAAINAGAYELVISGAGPTLLALSDATSAPDVALAMAEAWHQFSVKVEVRSLQIDTQGAEFTVYSEQ